MIKNEKTSKYGNKKVWYIGICFDSKVELEFYLYLLTQYDKKDIILQPKFELQPKFKYLNNNIRSIDYIADFQVGEIIYDVKGFATTDFKIKAKIFKYKYPELDLRLIVKMPVKYGSGWGLFEDLAKLRRDAKKIIKLKGINK